MNLIVCVQKQGDKWAIGNKNTLLFSFSDDLRFFKQHTEYKIIVMGKKTFESLPTVLNNRIHIILTRDENYNPYTLNKKNDTNSPLIVVHNLKELFAMVKFIVEGPQNTFSNDDVWVIGGGQIYDLLLPYCEEAYISFVEKQPLKEADTFFPNLDMNYAWKCTTIQRSEKDPISFQRYVNLYKTPPV